MSIMDLKVFKMINEDLNLKEIEEDILFSEINKKELPEKTARIALIWRT